jgi:uncharacterized protein YjbJ (UPF0337 family)
MSRVKGGNNMAAKDKLKNTAQIARGKMKEQAGKVTGNRSLESTGKSDRMKGDLKQASEKTKDALK